MDVPVACSLDAAATADRVAAWHDLMGRAAVAVDRAPGRVRVRLGEDRQALLDLVDLAQAEQACCPFLTVRLDLRGDGVVLELVAPDDAMSVLDALVPDVAPGGVGTRAQAGGVPAGADSADPARSG